MKLCILYEDDEIWIEMSTKEFSEKLGKKLKKDVKPAMKELVDEIKKETINK